MGCMRRKKPSKLGVLFSLKWSLFYKNYSTEPRNSPSHAGEMEKCFSTLGTFFEALFYPLFLSNLTLKAHVLFVG